MRFNNKVTSCLLQWHCQSVCLYTSICIAHRRNYLKCAQTWITQFYLQITPCLPLLPSRRASPPFGWYSFTVPRRVEGWVDLGGWLHTEIKCRRRESNPDTVTHPSTTRARRRVTSLIRPTPLPLRHAATPSCMYVICHVPHDNLKNYIWAIRYARI